MSQHDYNIANAGGAAVRADINAALDAIKTGNSGAVAPSVTAAFLRWYDTATGFLKRRNKLDTMWVPEDMYVQAADFGNTGGNTVQNLAGVTPGVDGVYYDCVSFYNGFAATTRGALGGGLFVWDASRAKSQHNGGTIISPTVPGVGSQSLAAFLAGTGETAPGTNGVWVRVDRAVPYDTWFGAKVDGVTDDSAAVQKAINIFSSGSGTVLLEQGDRVWVSDVTIAQNGVVVEGVGNYASRVIYSPTAAGTALTISKGASVCYGSGFRNIWFSSPDTTYTKTAVKFSDVSGAIHENLRVTSWTKTIGKDCVGLMTLGRECTAYKGCEIQADIPINIGNNPNYTIDANEFDFSDCYLVAASTQPCVKVDDGVYWTGLKFSGVQSWVHGAYGFYYSNTTSASANQKLVFEGVWKEQTDISTGYVIYISNTAGYCQDVTLNNVTGDTACKGVYGRGIVNLNFIGGNITSTSEALNVDGTVLNMTGVGLRTAAGATATLTNQQLMSATARHQSTSPLPDTFTYQSTSSMGQSQANFGPIKVTSSGSAIIVAGANNQKILDATETTNNVQAQIILTNGYLLHGTVSNHGLRFGTNNSTRWEVGAAGSLVPFADNTYSFGDGTHRPTVLYAVSGTINTSDARTKQDVRRLDEKELAVAKRLKGLIRAFRFIDAVEKKGDGARIHVGVIAQDVKAAFEAEGLDGFQYAVLCHDTWEDQPEEWTPAVVDDDGNEVIPAKLDRPAIAAGDRYGVRYDQLWAFILAAL